MSNSLYDLYLGDVTNLQGYRIKSMVRDSAPLVSSKFSTGKQGQSDLDLLKVESVANVGGGQFQRQHIEPTKVARVVGNFNRFDENVYPTVPRSAALSPTPFGNILCKAENSQYVFAGFSYVSGSITTQYLYYMVAGATNFTLITLPAAMTGNAESINGHMVGMAIHRGYVFMGMQHPNGEMNNYRYNIAAGTFQDIGGRSSLWGVLRGILYTINKDGTIYSCSNEFTAGAITYTSLDTIGNASQPNDMQEFNGALWIAKPEGIFRWDGVKGVKVLDHVTTKLQVFNGALYFVSGNWLYRFDGASVTRLQYFADSFGGFAASTDYLFIATLVTTSTYQTTDKFGTQNTTDNLRRIYMYDGVGFYLLDERTCLNSSTAYSNLYYTGNYLFDYNLDNGTVSNYRYEMNKTFIASAVTTGSKIDITTSDFDDGFPNVFKSLEAIEVEYSGIVAGDTIAVGYQYHDGTAWSSWVSLGNITSTSGNRIEINDSTKKLFKKLKISVIAAPTAGTTLAVKGVSWRYSLQPRVRWRWQANLIAYGNGKVKDRNGAAINSDANALTNQILKAVKQKTPLVMLSPDYGQVKAQITNAALSFIVLGQIPIYTDPYSEYPLVGVKNNSGVWEVLRVSGVSYNSGTDETTITVLERGYLGVTPAQINAGAEFHLAYKVYATRLLRESPILTDNTYNEQATTAESQLQREFMLEITEI